MNRSLLTGSAFYFNTLVALSCFVYALLTSNARLAHLPLYIAILPRARCYSVAPFPVLCCGRETALL
jgi:hypothetical protein